MQHAKPRGEVLDVLTTTLALVRRGASSEAFDSVAQAINGLVDFPCCTSCKPRARIELSHVEGALLMLKRACASVDWRPS